MASMLVLWGHALAALLFAGVAFTRLRDAGTALPRLTFVVALGMTALWALAVAGIDARDITTRVAESLRNLAWLGFMYALVRRDPGSPERRAVVIIYGVVAMVTVAGIGLGVAEGVVGHDEVVTLANALPVLRMMVAISALLLVHHLYA